MYFFLSSDGNPGTHERLALFKVVDINFARERVSQLQPLASCLAKMNESIIIPVALHT
jgi:hypothetical protein